METELTQLEDRVDQVLALCQRLNVENQSLRGQVSELESERRRLSDKIGAAAKRLEELKELIPQ